MRNLPRVVTIGGGTGNYVSLMGLKKYDLKLTAVVNMFDDGGSTGVLRDELGVLPPGDVRQCLVALSESSLTLRKLFNYRFEEGGLKGHTFGNIFLSALEKETGSFKKAIKEIGKILRIKGDVLPITYTKSTLNAKLTDGTLIKGQHHVDVLEEKITRAPISQIYLKPKAKINADVKKALFSADFIIIGPGDLYTSILPNILVNDASNFIKKSRAKKIFIMNLMTKYGQTSGWGAKKHLEVLESYLGKGIIDLIILNTGNPHKDVLSWYAKYHEEPIKDDFGKKEAIRIIREDLLKDVLVRKSTADILRRSIIRHDSEKLASEIMKIIKSGHFA